MQAGTNRRMSASRLVPALGNTALVCVMLLPPLLLHAHGMAEAAIGLADSCFLLSCAVRGDWAWLRVRWFRAAGAWWGWLVVCSLPIAPLGLGEGGIGSLLQALATVRFLLLVAAMEHLVLRTANRRLWLYRIVAASAAWIVLNSVVQFAFGRNLLGWPRGPQGELTGPFGTPRAGPALTRIILPAVMPAVAALAAPKKWRLTLCAYALLFGSVVVMVLTGQRMPLVLMGLGLVIVAFLIRPLRPAIFTAALVGALLLAASPLVAPSAHDRLVERFSNQMRHFAVSPYGELYARAWEVGRRNPLTGLGFDGFNTGCPQPRYFRPTFDGSEPDGGGARICWHHPHNVYFQALDDGGFIGLTLFCVMAVAWLLPLGRGLWHRPDAVRVGLFAAACIQLWPVQSSTGFTSMPIGGWFFLLLGWGMALCHDAIARENPSRE